MNGDGAQGGEAGLPGILVRLLDSNGMEITSTSTDSSGMYLFENLREDSYTVEVAGRNDLLPTFDLDGGLDSSAVVALAAGEHRRDVDFGFERKF